MTAARTRLKGILVRHEMILFVILIAYCTFVSIVNPTFLQLDNLFDVFRNSAGMMILAMGTLVVLVSGGIDVSFTAVAICSGYLTMKIFIGLGFSNIILIFLVSAFIGVLLGLFNGFWIQQFRLQTLIVTLGTQNIFIGLLSLTLGTRFIPVGQMPKAVVDFGTNALLSVPLGTGGRANLTLFILPVVLVVLVTWFILRHTVLGKRIYALGSNAVSAERAGVNVALVRYFVYGFMGGLAGLMGVVYGADVRSFNPISLVGKELTIIAAVVLGGASLTGGRGTVLGTVLGVLIISILNTTLILIGLSASWNDFFVGTIIVLSVAATAYRNKRKNESNLIFI
jgi:simple sugar transport system permease protein